MSSPVRISVAALVGAVLLSPLARAGDCGVKREGRVFAVDSASGKFFVFSTPVTFGEGTRFVSVSGKPTSAASLLPTQQITAQGCLGADGFTLEADVVTIHDGPSPLTLASDVSITFGEIGSSAYYIESTSEPSVGPVGIGDPNPTLTLRIGTRYACTYGIPGSHPFAFVSLGADGSQDSVLLAQGSGIGSFESDLAVNWVQPTANEFTFTLTGALADEMLTAAAFGPGYRCNVHTDSMRGAIVFGSVPSAFAWATSTETFENAALNTLVSDAFDGYVIVTNDAPNYRAIISDQPAAAPGQAAGSTRWLRIEDDHDDATVNDRVYPPAITAPSGESVTSYSYSWYMNVEATQAGTKGLVIAQHFDNVASSFRNVGGLEVTDSGVNVVVLGADESGFGTAGTTVRTALYSFADPSGAFDQDEWVRVSFTMDFANGEISAEALGSDGVTTATAASPGLVPQGGGFDRGNQRFCIRNLGTANRSTICYDEITFNGTSILANVKRWDEYE